MTDFGRFFILFNSSRVELEYEAREKAILDYNQGMYEAEQRGEQRGRQYSEQRIRNTARKLLSLGVDINIIAESTSLSIAEIEALQK